MRMPNLILADSDNGDFKMTDEQNEIFLNNGLKQDQIPVAIELAEALRADEVEKFLELYDNIPKTLETERVHQIKEMARQLAALPKKQFEMYRSKHKTLVSREVLNLQASSLNTPDKLGLNRIETKPKDLELKEIFLDMTLNANEASETPTKSAKKKSKKKKKKASNAAVETPIVNEVELTSKDSSVIIENKLLDSGESGSRIATMNKNIVADISVVSPKITSSKNQSIQQVIVDNDVEEIVSTENIKQAEVETSDLPEELNHISPPFGYPLSTDKLIQSAIELLSCEPSNDIYKIDCNAANKQPCETEKQDFQDFSNISIDSSLDVNVLVDNDSGKGITRSPDPKNLKVDESVDGDVSNLSAWDEDEGWQSQGRRSHRKKKKELLQSRERSIPKGNRDTPKESKQNYKRQNPRNSHNKHFTGKTNNSQGMKTFTSQPQEKDGIEKIEKTFEETSDSTVTQTKEKQQDKESNNCGTVFSYRDALLKAKAKPTEELQYNSDSGVDVNSVGSCDSAIHSPKIPNEFDLEEAVNFLMKGWNEVKQLHKKGQVVFHREVDDPVPANKKKNFRKAAWHAKPRHHIK